MQNVTWRELNHILGTKTETEVEKMLADERAGRRRIVMLERLHQRYNSLRVARERMEILREATSK